MKFYIVIVLLTLILAGCSPVPGERFWWSDQKQTKLENDYELPDWPVETPLAAGERPYVDRKFPADEVERARKQEREQIAAGIPRCGVPEPMANPVPVKVAQWDDTAQHDETPSAPSEKPQE